MQTSKDKLREVFEKKFGIKIDKHGNIKKEQKEVTNLIIKNKFMEILKNLSTNKGFIKEANLKVKMQKHAQNGVILLKKFNIDGAITEMEKAIDIAEKNFPNDINLLATLYHNFGSLYVVIGDGKAIFYLKKAIERYKSLSRFNPRIPVSYHQLAVAYRNMGDYNASLKNYKISLKLKEKNSFSKKSLASTYVGLADLYNHLKEYNKSLELNKKVLLLRSNSLSNRTVYHNMSVSFIKLKDYKKALVYAQKSLELIKSRFKEKMPVFRGIYALFGEIYYRLGEYKQSLAYLQKSLKVAPQISTSNLFISERHNDIAKNYFKMNQFNQAYQHLELAFDMFSALKKGSFLSINQEHKKTYMSRIQQHSNFIDSLFKIGYSYQKKNQDILNRWLNYKRSIFDIENNLKILYNTSSDKKIKESIDRLFENQRKLARLKLIPPSDEPGTKLYNKRVEKVKENISNEEIFLNKKTLKLNSKPITYQQVSNILKANELYVDFARMEDTYFYFTLDKEKNIKFEKFSNKESQEIEKMITRIREDMGKHFNVKISQKRYAKLYDLIISKIDIKNKTSLIISPDGLLGLIPFEAFYDKKEKQYLVKKVNIRYIPSGKELVKLYQNKKTAENEDIVVFSEVDFEESVDESTQRGSIFDTLEPNLSSLKFSKHETDVIKMLFPNKVKLFLGKEATESNLLQVKSPKILHLSTHGYFPKNNKTLNPMEKSLILLSGANESIREKKGDGLVSGLELAGLNLNGTQLVVLSACETGVGEVENAEGISGLKKAFIKAGANHIVMSLWSVSDRATSKLMEYFYNNIAKGEDYTLSLNNAKRSMINSKDNNQAHPYYWSGFIGSGI